jgi:hypothetical protein
VFVGPPSTVASGTKNQIPGRKESCSLTVRRNILSSHKTNERKWVRGHGKAGPVSDPGEEKPSRTARVCGVNRPVKPKRRMNLPLTTAESSYFPNRSPLFTGQICYSTNGLVAKCGNTCRVRSSPTSCGCGPYRKLSDAMLQADR